jgi:predicted nucleic acid-binding protein
VRADVLADTGALLALLDADDRWHRRCVDALRALRMPMITSEAVLTELFHLVGDDPRDLSRTWDFVRSGALTIAAIDDFDLLAIRRLAERYADRPMDFADATLVHLAEREGIRTVFTIDHADFATYRTEKRRALRVVPTPV